MDVIDILMAKMLSGGGDPEAIKEAVDEYLEEHGVHITESDPTVPAWAKEPDPPTYTAEDVGALPDVPVTASDNGKVLTVNDQGEWGAAFPQTGLPSYGTASDGRVLTIATINQAKGLYWLNPPTELPAEGSAGQVLKKTSDGVAWANESGGSAELLTVQVTKNGETYSTAAKAADIMDALPNVILSAPGTEGEFSCSGFYIDGGMLKEAYFSHEIVDTNGVKSLEVFLLKQITYGSDTVIVTRCSTPALPAPVQADVGKVPTANASGGYSLQTPGGGSAEPVPRVAMTAQNTTAVIEPNKLYVFPEMASLAITLAAVTDSTIANEYHFLFTSGATATSPFTLPGTIAQPEDFTVEANHVYEVSIMENRMTAQGWAVSTA